MSAFSTEEAAGQQRGAQRQPQKQRANRTVPTQKPTNDAPVGESESLLNKKQQKSADRLQKYNLEMTAILGLKLRFFMLRALKRARYERVWSVVRPFLKKMASTRAMPSPQLILSSSVKACAGLMVTRVRLVRNVLADRARTPWAPLRHLSHRRKDVHALTL